MPFFEYPPEARKIIYTTNAMESMRMQLRNIKKDWKVPPVTWKQAVNQHAILFGERFTNGLRYDF